MPQGIDYFSTATDYIAGASNFFLNVFDLGATTFETVRDRVKTLQDPDMKEAEKKSIFENFKFDKENTITILAVGILAVGLIYAARR